MASYEFDLPFPDTYDQFLKELIKRAIVKKSLTGFYYGKPGGYIVNIGSEDFFTQLEGNPFLAFESCGLISLPRPTPGHDNTLYFVIKPKAFSWENYHKKNRVGKWLERNPQPIRDGFLAVAFLLSLGLTILQILQALDIIP